VNHINTVARWPKIRVKYLHTGPEKILIPGKIGARKLTKFGKKLHRRDRKIKLQ
jgi:hypothetical protein